MNFIEIKAPAKINLGLFVVSKRSDGYHNLNTLFYPICDLFDTITFQKSNEFIFTCSDTSIPNDGNNLVVKAVKLLEKIKGNNINVSIELNKRIPSQAGLGGGSSDAAATLISINEMFKIGLDNEQLLISGLELGADVPFFIKAKAAVGKSRGELLELIDLQIDNPIMLVNPHINISTKEAFSNVAVGETKIDLKLAIKNNKPDFCFLRKHVGNDFEPYIFKRYPEIETIKEKMYIAGAEYALLSGSGSTVYGIFPDTESAEKMKDSLPKDYFCWISNPDH